MIQCEMMRGPRKRRIRCEKEAAMMVGTAKVLYCAGCAAEWFAKCSPKYRNKIEVQILDASTAAEEHSQEKP